MTLHNKTYDVLKQIAQIWLPAAGALYFGLSAIWGLPNAEQVVGTVTVVDTFLGVVLGISTDKYNSVRNPAGKFDGAAVVNRYADGAIRVVMEPNADPVELVDKTTLVFQVQQNQIDATHREVYGD